MVRLASNSTCLGLVETLLSPPQKIHRAEILNKIMIEKRISYQEGNGVGSLDPLEIIVFLMGKRASPGGLSYAEEKELDRLIKETGYMSQKKAKGG